MFKILIFVWLILSVKFCVFISDKTCFPFERVNNYLFVHFWINKKLGQTKSRYTWNKVKPNILPMTK